MLLNVKAYRNKNNIPPLQGNYLISALPCHCKPLLSAPAPSQPLIPRVFQLFPGCICTKISASFPSAVPVLQGTVTRGMSCSQCPSPGSCPAQQPCPAPCQALQLPHDLVAVRGLGRLRDAVALRLDHLHRGLAIVQQALQQLGGGKGRGKLPDWGSRTSSSPWRGHISNCGSEPLPVLG